MAFKWGLLELWCNEELSGFLRKFKSETTGLVIVCGWLFGGLFCLSRGFIESIVLFGDKMGLIGLIRLGLLMMFEGFGFVFKASFEDGAWSLF